jgi:hypothetical protein
LPCRVARVRVLRVVFRLFADAGGSFTHGPTPSPACGGTMMLFQACAVVSVCFLWHCVMECVPHVNSTHALSSCRNAPTWSRQQEIACHVLHRVSCRSKQQHHTVTAST